MLKIRRSWDRLIFNMGIPIPGKDGLYIETGPRTRQNGLGCRYGHVLCRILGYFYRKRRRPRTHPVRLDKMAAISQTKFSDEFSWIKIFAFGSNLAEGCFNCPIDNIPALIWIMACRRIGYKQLFEPVLTRFTDAYAALGEGGLNIRAFNKEIQLKSSLFTANL